LIKKAVREGGLFYRGGLELVLIFPPPLFFRDFCPCFCPAREGHSGSAPMASEQGENRDKKNKKEQEGKIQSKL
jgi:hypothetical protein